MTQIITLKFSNRSGVSTAVWLDGAVQKMSGEQRNFDVSAGPHKIEIGAIGSLGGKVDWELFHAGKVIKSRKPFKLPNGSQRGFDETNFTI